MEKNLKNAVQTIAELGQKANGASIITIKNVAKIAGVPDEVPAILVNGDAPYVENIANTLNAYRTLPKRKKGVANIQSLTSFIELTNRHKTKHSAIFASIDWKDPSLKTVVNYHRIDNENGAADFLDHTVNYKFPLSEEWVKWQENDGQQMSQNDFAAFLEDRIAELAAPTPEEIAIAKDRFATTTATPAKMMELSRGLQINIDSQVKNTTTLQSGEGQITWTETHNDTNGKPISVPGTFIISIAPFYHGEVVRVPVRLRYRAKSGSIVWFYQIYRPDLAIDDVVQKAIDRVKTETDLPVFEGEPEKA